MSLQKSTVERYIQPLLAGDRQKCKQIVDDTIQNGAPPRAVIENLIWPAMEAVDKLYRTDRINVAVEHMATRINRLIADQVQSRLPVAPSNGRRVLIMCANDEPEELGAQMCAGLFEADGWDTYFAGGGVPHDEILSLVGQLRPALLLIFGSKPSDAPPIRTLVTTIREVNVNPEMNIMVSGGVFNRAAGLWQEVRADLFAATARDALSIANESGPRAAAVEVRTEPGKKRRRRRRSPLLETAGAA